MKGHFNTEASNVNLLLETGAHSGGKSTATRNKRRETERRLLKQSQEPKPNKPTKGFK
jgi:hypothetical protein